MLSSVRDEPAINPGNAKNRLELRCAGAKISASVNGKVVASADDMTMNRGDHGMGAGAFTGIQGTIEARYDNLEIRVPYWFQVLGFGFQGTDAHSKTCDPGPMTDVSPPARRSGSSRGSWWGAG